MIEPSIPARADYADAILVARRAKNWLFLILLIVLLGEIALFFAARQTTFIPLDAAATAGQVRTATLIRCLISIGLWAGLAGAIVLSLTLLFLSLVMLVSRTLGVAKASSAFVWSLLLLVLLFPWQAVLSNPTLGPADPHAENFKVPGVLYTWTELSHPTLGTQIRADPVKLAVLHWSRFVAFPAIATIILLAIQIKSSRGIKAALGESPSAPESSLNL